MPNNILAFSKYLSHPIGGAELSMYNILKEEESRGKKIKIVSFKNLKNFGSNHMRSNYNKNWSHDFIQPKVLFSKFPHYEYFINKIIVEKYFYELSESIDLLTYSLYAPAAINAYQGGSTFYLRSASDLLIRENFSFGLKRKLKFLYLLLGQLGVEIYRKELFKALSKAKVIANSNFMGNLLKDIFGINCIVQLPKIELGNTKKKIEKLNISSNNKGIVFVGDSEIKGLYIAEKISKSMQNENFFFFSRYTLSKKIENNITYFPWQSDRENIYAKAKLVIIPSICLEAYGRVAREAFLLDIPVLVSNIGGLPEAVDYIKDYIIDDFKNHKSWINSINLLTN